MENYYRSQKENIFRNVEVPPTSCILVKYIEFCVLHKLSKFWYESFFSLEENG